MPDTRIVVVCNQKGGRGKTTMAGQLAGSLARRGNQVLVVDADQQGTATRWAASAPDDAPFPATVIGLSATEGKIHREIKRHVANYDYILVDCPPAVESPVPASALVVADLAVVPVIPSPADLWSTLGIRTVIRNVSEINDTLQARLVINQCDPNRRLAREALTILPEYGIPVCRSFIRHREIYRQAIALGATVHDMGQRAASAVAEIEALTDELLALLAGEAEGSETTQEVVNG